MSNYPPGVTGNEWQIAGPDLERDEHKECGAEGFTVRTTTGFGQRRIEDAIEALLNGSHAPTVLFYLRSALGEIDVVDVETPCPFVGDVEVVYFRGTAQWTCPLCRTEHEEEMD